MAQNLRNSILLKPHQTSYRVDQIRVQSTTTTEHVKEMLKTA